MPPKLQPSGTKTLNAADDPDDRDKLKLITVQELADVLSLSARTIWRMLGDGIMVEPVRIGKNVRWRLYEVRHWIDDGCPPFNRRND